MKYFLSVGAVMLFTLTLVAQSHAATVMYMNSGNIDDGFGNSDTRAASDGNMVTVTAWSWDRSANDNSWTTGQLREYGGGLGICNQSEGLNGSANCSSVNARHSADNRNHRKKDFFLFEFNQNVILEEATVTAWNTGNNGLDPGPRTADSDVSYWGGTGAIPDFSNTGAGFLGTRTDNNGVNRFNGQTREINLSGISDVTWLLIGAHANHSDDGIKLKSIEFTTVPIPDTALLFGTGLLGFIVLARRKNFLKKS